MKSIIFSIVLVFAFLIGNTQNIVSVKGKIKKSKTRKVWIYNFDKSISDTVKLNIFRKFKYSNNLEIGELCFVKPLECSYPLVFNIKGNSEINFKTKIPNIHKNLSVLGNTETSTASEFFNRMSQFQYRVKETEEKLYKDETAEGQYYYDSVLSSIHKELDNFKMEFVKKNKNVSTLILMNDFVDYEKDYQLMLELEKGLRENHSNTGMYEKLSYEIDKYELYQLKVESKGDEVPILILPGIDEADISMQDLTGNYILIDFWASWCAPCRAGHPSLVKLYKKYNDKGFEIYSVSMDKSKDKWIKAISKDQLSWSSHVSSLKGFDCPTVNMFDIKGLPFNVLIDKKGNVLELNLKGKKLEEKLKQIFDENN